MSNPGEAVAVDPQRTGAATQDTLAATMLTGHARSDGGGFVDDEPIADGTSVGRYVVVGRIGAGGMGVVYMAFDPELGRRVALKLLRRTAGDGERARRRLQREAQALARLSHPNVVTIYDVGEHEGQVFLAMEFVQGQTLRKWLKERQRDYEEIVRVLVEAGRGLLAAHDKGLIHRDFKPDNVMVDGDGRARVMDFGLVQAGEVALSLTGTSTHGSHELEVVGDDLLTQGRGTQGTPAYMAPEQHLREATDERTDQFSFCVTLYEALYDERPFAGDSLAALSWSITEGKLSPVPKGRPVPSRVQRAILRGLSTIADERWPSLRVLLDELTYDPRPARRRWAAVGVVVGVLGTLGGWWQLSRSQAEAACRTEGEAIAEVWHGQRSATVGAALVRTEVAFAEDSWRRASEFLDDYASQWSEQRTEACRAATIEHRWTASDLTRARACFDERRARVDALLDTFAEPDETMTSRVVPAFLQLPPLSDCTDAAWLARRPPISDEPGARSRELELRHRLVGVNAAIAAGRYARAQEDAEAVITAAQSDGATALRADAELALGSALERQGAYDQAVEHLQDALYTAGGVGHDTTALDAAIRLTFVVGYQLSKPEEGLRWSSMAEMFITRLGLSDDPNVVQWLTNLGSLHQMKGTYDEAYQAQSSALAMAERVYGDEHPRLSVQWTNLANAEHGRGDSEAALRAHERALAIREATMGPEHPNVANSLVNVGVAQHGQGRTEDAVASFERALTIQTAALGERHPMVATTLNNLGAMLFSMGEDERALAIYERALDIQRSTLGEEHHETASFYNNLARVLSRMGRHDEALVHYERALAIRIETKGPEHPHVARVHSSMGRSYLQRGDHEQAVQSQRKALAIWEAAHGEEHPSVGTALYNLGEALLEAGRADEAMPLLRRSLRVREAVSVPLEKVGRVRFALARAIVQSGGDVDEAVAMARQGQQQLAEVSEVVERIDAWVREVEG